MLLAVAGIDYHFIILIFFFNAQNRIQKNTIQAAICSVHD